MRTLAFRRGVRDDLVKKDCGRSFRRSNGMSPPLRRNAGAVFQPCAERSNERAILRASCTKRDAQYEFRQKKIMSKKQSYILGLNTYDHDVSACLLRDGEIAFAIAKERITREKHASGFYREVIDYCLKAEGIALDDVDLVVRNCLYSACRRNGKTPAVSAHAVFSEW
jgi:hypothetical protein